MVTTVVDRRPEALADLNDLTKISDDNSDGDLQFFSIIVRHSWAFKLRMKSHPKDCKYARTL